MTTTEIKTFTRLFKHKTEEKIYYWEISVDDIDGDVTITTSHGLIDGNPVNHTKIISEGKGKKTVEEQAVFQAQKKWNDKIKKENYTSSQKESVRMFSDKTSVKESFRSMLAGKHSPDDPKKNKVKKFPVYVQRKYDGVRCACYYDDKTKEIVFMSRTGERFGNVNLHHIESEVRNFFENSPHQNFVLDGELYSHSKDAKGHDLGLEYYTPFQELVGLIKKQTLTRENENRLMLIYYEVYDVYLLDEPEMPFESRHEWLTESFRKTRIGESTDLRLSPTFLAMSHQEIEEHYELFVNDRYEGLMVRKPMGKYAVGKRSNDLLKYKKFMEEEFEIIGYHEGTGDHAGTVVWEAKTKEDKKFSATPDGTLEYRAQLLLNADKYIGKLLTVKFFEYTNDGKPRFPIGKAIREGY